MNHITQRIIIIGGMGPQASLELHRRIIAGAARNGAKNGDDYPEIVHISIPVPDFISSDDTGPGLLRLRRSLQMIRITPKDTVIVACNTAHLLLPELEARLGIRCMSLIDATVEAVHAGSMCIGLLASPTTIKTKLYEQPLAAIGCRVVRPKHSETDILEQVIRHIIAGGEAAEARPTMQPIIQRMVADGAEQILLGCTELSVLFEAGCEAPSVLRIIDPLDAITSKLLSQIGK